MGHTRDDFNNLGKIPSLIDLFMIDVSGGAKNFENSFNILVGILKGPHDFDTFNSFIIPEISLTVHSRLWRM